MSLNVDHNDRSLAANRQAGTFFYFQPDSHRQPHTVGTQSVLGVCRFWVECAHGL